MQQEQELALILVLISHQNLFDSGPIVTLAEFSKRS